MRGEGPGGVASTLLSRCVGGMGGWGCRSLGQACRRPHRRRSLAGPLPGRPGEGPCGPLSIREVSPPCRFLEISSPSQKPKKKKEVEHDYKMKKERYSGSKSIYND